MDFKIGVKNIQAAGYNGTGTVFGLLWLINVQFGANQMRKNVRNHVKLGVSLRVLYCVVDTGYGLGKSLGDCRPALPKGEKYQTVKT